MQMTLCNRSDQHQAPESSRPQTAQAQRDSTAMVFRKGSSFCLFSLIVASELEIVTAVDEDRPELRILRAA